MIAMAHPLLEFAHRYFGRGRHPCAEGVAEVVKADLAHTACPQRPFEAANQRGVVERIAGERVREDEVGGGAEARTSPMSLQLAGDTSRERH